VVSTAGRDVRVGHTGCICGEYFGVTKLEDLDRLVNDKGMDQIEASRLLWAQGAVT